ncbi:MAG: Ig-like domain-containing protein [Deltaproteobacteria bacterium]|nr:Ig-like domain-containing protein [Deltaproteobacteria bacterium]
MHARFWRNVTLAVAIGTLLFGCGNDEGATATTDAAVTDTGGTVNDTTEPLDAAKSDAAADVGSEVADTGPSDGTPCDDGRACTVGDAYKDGACVSGENQCPCEPEFKACPKPIEEDVINLCAGPKQCVATPDGASLPYQCVADPNQAKICSSTADTDCLKQACVPATGTCALVAIEETVEICDQPDNGCRREVLGANGTPPDPTACDDGVACTTEDTCVGGKCVGSGVSACTCTVDADCEDDGDKCNGVPYCDKSTEIWTCKANLSTAVVCDTSTDNACQQTLCEQSTGACKKTPKPKGFACKDGVACTEGDACDGAGSCIPGTWICCKDDLDCVDKDDGNLCNGTMFCNIATGECLVNPASVVNCAKTNDTQCKQAKCVPATGTCALLPANEKAPCDDGDFCTDGDVCAAGDCKGGKDVCGCSKDADCVKYDDGDLCNGTYYCNLAAGSCKLNPTTIVNCPTVDDTECAKAACEPQSGLCKPAMLPAGVTCDADGTECTAADACDGKGACVAGTTICPCQIDSDCASQEDGDLCNGTLYCDLTGEKPACKVNKATVVSCPTAEDGPCEKNTCVKLTGLCTMQKLEKNVPCEDGDPCIGDDRCDGQGNCKPGQKVLCGCQKLSDCAPFDDETVCNGSYQCVGGACLFDGIALECNDGKPCTIDACDAKTGCTHTPLPGCVPCKVDADCDDDKECTVDSCDLAAGCQFLPQAEGTEIGCYEGAVGTSGVGVCKAGKRTCDGKGNASACVGQVIPAAKDDCGGGDQDCDGPIDEDCVGPAKIAPVCGEGQSAAPGTAAFETLTVQVLDKSDNPVPNATVVWSAPDGGKVAEAQTVTNGLGMSTNTLTVGGDSGKTYRARATAQGGKVVFDFVVKADAAVGPALLSYVHFCDSSKLVLTGDAAFIPDAVRLVTDFDSKNGTAWFAKPIKPGASFATTFDVAGFSAGYAFVIHAATTGTTQTAGGYGDNNTPKLEPALVIQTKGVKGGGQISPATMTISVDGVQLVKDDNFMPEKTNQLPRTYWIDYDAPTTTLTVSSTPLGEAKPAVAQVTVKADVWAGMLASGKAAYAGFTAGNASAGVRGDKDITRWWMAYKDAPCFVEGKVCDDNNECTDDSCDQSKGCVYKITNKACDDGDACTEGDTCGGGACIPGKAKVCEDANACTDDSCDKALGCVNAPNTTPCDDGQLCTKPDLCKAGACAAGTVDTCDDGWSCTVDVCDPQQGCQHTKNSDLCDDGSPCSSDSCIGEGGEAKTGCSYNNLPQGFSVACYDHDPKTIGVGNCKTGTTQCDGNGKAGSCIGQVGPAADDPCGNDDEDCDGLTNEDCGITYKISATCGNSQTAQLGANVFARHIVKVTDGSNIALSGVTVTWDAPDGGKYQNATTKTDAAGLTWNQFSVGTKDGTSYVGTATIDGSAVKATFSALASASAPTYVLNYTNFCDTSKIKMTGVAAVEGVNMRPVTGGDNQNGSFWFTDALAAHKGKSFAVQYDVSGYCRGYSFVIQSVAAGTSQPAGGYGDSGTKNLNPALVLQVEGGKGGGSYGPPSLYVRKSGSIVKDVGSVMGTNQNNTAYTWWVDYDAGGKKLSIYTAPKGSAKPSTPKVAETVDVWAGIGDNGKPIYTGFTAGNSSAGSNGTKYVTRWQFQAF